MVPVYSCAFILCTDLAHSTKAYKNPPESSSTHLWVIWKRQKPQDSEGSVLSISANIMGAFNGLQNTCDYYPIGPLRSPESVHSIPAGRRYCNVSAPRVLRDCSVLTIYLLPRLRVVLLFIERANARCTYTTKCLWLLHTRIGLQ